MGKASTMSVHSPDRRRGENDRPPRIGPLGDGSAITLWGPNLEIQDVQDDVEINTSGSMISAPVETPR